MAENDVISFDKFNISKLTMRGLNEAKLTKPTTIQRKSLPASLDGKDVLGAAKTGSGKTLAFLIPVLELLHKEGFTSVCGLGALVITPTRELAYQIFEVLKDIGKYHSFSAALVIGGKDLKYETDKLASINILICTPGRLLQHMDQNAYFDVCSLKILVLDEADRLLDMGFKFTIDSILANLPEDRQTLLFSATQTKNINDLARLALNHPEYIFAHESSSVATPKALKEQTFSIINLPDKLNVLLNFLRTHTKCKILVFLSTCKQVKFVHDSFLKVNLSTPLLCLYGGLHQLRRIKVYDSFRSKQFVVLIATDIAARGLDFPDVDWVIQADCPEDVKTYIHRVGRTARKGGSIGKTILYLQPHEKEFVGLLLAAKIPIVESKINTSKIRSVKGKLQGLLAENVELHETAKRAFCSYIKFINNCKMKDIFDVKQLDVDAFASSLGLLFTPKSKIVKTIGSKKSEDIDDIKNALDALDDAQDYLCSTSKTVPLSDLEDDFVALETRNKHEKVVTKAQKARTIMRKGIKANTHRLFDSDQEENVLECTELDQDFIDGGINVDAMAERLKSKDKLDRNAKKELLKGRRRKQKMKSQDNFDSDQEMSGVQLKVARIESPESNEFTQMPSSLPRKSDLFDYDSLAKQEDAILKLFD